MTESEIRSLTGPKLDAAIAEMMGWKFQSDEFGRWWVDEAGELVHEEYWYPSTSWADLGVVVAWMEGEGWEHSHDFGFRFLPMQKPHMWSWHKNDKYVCSYGSTFPEAACRASLLTQEEAK